MTYARTPLVHSAAAITVSIGLLFSLACSADTLLRPSAGGSVPAFSNLPPGTTETLVASGLRSPTAMAVLPDGRVLVNEQCSAVRVVKNGALLGPAMVEINTDCGGERGILGVAVDPAFASNHRIFVYYTVPTSPVHNRVSSFTVSGDMVVAGSEQILLDLDNLTADYHNGGALHFGPDGRLYIGVGDNGTSSNAQTTSNLFGKILRIGADGSIPTDNPFFTTATGKNRAIWAMGLRNPWTFGFQPGTGRMFIDDVGESTFEEINDGIAGANYGWPTCEGPCSPARAGLRDPFYYYGHGTGCAITGGTFYNPGTARLPAAYVGKYFFVDYCEGAIRTLDPSSKAVAAFSTGLSSPVDLQVSSDGYFYYLQRDGGQLWRVTGTASQVPIITQQPANLLVSAGQPATFAVTATGPGTLTYQWRRGTTNISGATSSSYTLATTALTDNGATFNCVVSNGFGSTPSTSATLTVTSNKPPTATILTPVAGTTYRGGQSFSYSATAADPETGALPASAFTWQVVFHHDTHTHPFVGATSGSTSGTFVIPTIGEVSANVYYAILLTVTDPFGLSATVERDIHPQTSTFTVQSVPAGAKVTLDGQPVTAPVSVLGVVGIQRTIGAVSPQTLGTTSYHFNSWSDGGTATHTFSTATANTTYTANFLAGGQAVTATVTAQNKTYNGTTAAKITSCTVSGSPAGVTCSSAAATFATATVGTGKTVTATGITLAGSNAGQYSLTSTTATTSANITKLPLGAHVTAANKVYDGTTTATITGCTLSNMPAGVTCSPASATFASAAVGTAKTVTATGLTLAGPNAGNYSLTGTTAFTTANITTAPVTAAVTAANKGFDGTTTATITGCTLSGSPVGVTCSAAAANFSSAAVGNGKTVTATGITLAGVNAANYHLTATTATTTANITAAGQTPVTATVTAQHKTYNGTTAAKITSCTVSGSPAGVTCSSAAATFATATVGTGKTVTATGITLAGSNAGQYSLTSTTATTSANITKLPLGAHVTAANKVFDGTTTATITGCTLTNNPAGVTCSPASAAFASAAVGNGKTVTATGLTLAGPNAGNYSLTGTTAFTTANITPAP